MVPALDQLYLIGPSGGVLAELIGASADFQGDRQDVSVGLSHVASGSSLVVRIIEDPLPTATVSGSTGLASAASPVQTGTGEVPFTMEVTRFELSGAGLGTQAPGLAIGVNNSASLPIGYTPLTSLLGPPGTSFGAISTTAFAINPPQAEMLLGNGTNPSVAAQPIEENPIVPPVVSVGPFVSRGAVPLGPLLATSPGDPTPALDRTERANDSVTLGPGMEYRKRFRASERPLDEGGTDGDRKHSEHAVS